MRASRRTRRGIGSDQRSSALFGYPYLTLIVLPTSIGYVEPTEKARGSQGMIIQPADRPLVVALLVLALAVTILAGAIVAENVQSTYLNTAIASTEPDQHNWWSSEWWLVYLTAALALLAAAQIVVFIWQLRMMRSSLKDAEDAANAAKESATAAKESVETARDTAKKQLRAYLGVSGITIEISNPESPTSHADGIFWDFTRLAIRNAGQTPARNVKVHVNWVWGNFSAVIPAGFGYPDYNDPGGEAAGGIESVAIVMPGDTYETLIGIGDNSPMKRAWKREYKMYFYGRVLYEDIYGESHRTTFCYAYEPWRERRTAFVPHGEYNEVT